MKRVVIIVVLLVAAILAGYTEEVSGKQSPEELKYDLDFLHPDTKMSTPIYTDTLLKRKFIR